MSFLTAIMQFTAREKQWALDSMTVQTNVTSLKDRSEVVNDPETGAYIDGLWLEGAAWENGGSG